MEHHGHAGPPGHGEHAGQGGHGDHAARFRDRFWWSLALSVPVVAYFEMVQGWLGFTPPQFPGSAPTWPSSRPGWSWPPTTPAGSSRY